MKIIEKIKALKKEQLCFIFVGILALVFGVFRIITNDAIVSKGVTVNAVITDSDGSHRYSDEEADGRNDYDIIYEYNGKTYENRIYKGDTSAFDSKNKGDTVYIYIDPENPERIALNGTPYGYFCIFGAVACFGIAYIIGCKKEARYKNYD